MLLFSLLLISGAALAAPKFRTFSNAALSKDCPLNNVTLTTAGYKLPPTALLANQSCLYAFSVPSGYYANVYIRLEGAGMEDYVDMFDFLADQTLLTEKGCDTDCDGILERTFNWPSDFFINTQTRGSTKMTVQLKIALKAETPYANVISTTALRSNDKPALLYFGDFKENTSYTFTAQTKVYIQVAPTFDQGIDTDLQNGFIYEGNNVTATLKFGYQYILSEGATVTIYLAEKITMTGAIFLTDYSNVKDLFEHQIQFVPITYPDHTSYAPADGYNGQRGAVTVIGEKDGSTPIDVRQLVTYGSGAGNPSFFSLPGGPLADNSKAVQMSPNKMPQHFTGNVNTFYVSGGTGSLKYTISQN